MCTEIDSIQLYTQYEIVCSLLTVYKYLLDNVTEQLSILLKRFCYQKAAKNLASLAWARSIKPKIVLKGQGRK